MDNYVKMFDSLNNFLSVDPSLLWYFVYLILTVLSLEVDRLFVSALLLDWVMIDATTRHTYIACKYDLL